MEIKCCDFLKKCINSPLWKKEVNISATIPLYVLIIVSGLLIGLICLKD